MSFRICSIYPVGCYIHIGKQTHTVFEDGLFHRRFLLHGPPKPRLLSRILSVPELGALLMALHRTDKGGITNEGHGGLMFVCNVHEFFSCFLNIFCSYIFKGIPASSKQSTGRRETNRSSSFFTSDMYGSFPVSAVNRCSVRRFNFQVKLPSHCFKLDMKSVTPVKLKGVQAGAVHTPDIHQISIRIFINAVSKALLIAEEQKYDSPRKNQHGKHDENSFLSFFHCPVTPFYQHAATIPSACFGNELHPIFYRSIPDAYRYFLHAYVSVLQMLQAFCRRLSGTGIELPPQLFL